MGRKNAFDKENEKPCKRGKPKKESSAAEGVSAEAEGEQKKGGAENGEEKKQGRTNGTNERGGKEDDKDGKEKIRKVLRKAVKKAIRDESQQIAKSLVHKAVDGDNRSTEMMFSLIEKKKKIDNGAMRHGGLTTADLLGSEDGWENETYEAMEDKSELGMGGREREQGDS
jgi:hypothetical protein